MKLVMDGVYGDTISEELAYSMSMMLVCVDNENMDTCSIHLVPEKLRKSKVEKIKWRCLMHLLNRASVGETDEALKKCCSVMLKLDKVVRESYSVDELEFDSSDLAKCMVLDGCFLLELLISGSPELDNKINNTSSDSSPGGHVIRWGKVLSDLTLLENQIPLVVLKVLSSKLFPHVFGGYGDTHGDILIQQLALSILGYDYASLGSSCGKLNVYNFLELVHAFTDNEKSGTKTDVKIPIDSGEDESNRRLKLNRCANRLLETDMDPWISEVILQLNSYRSTLCSTGTFRITWHVLRGNLTLFCYNWMHSFRLLRRDYIPTRWKLIAVIAAAAGVILTAAQTFFSARGN